MSADLYNEIGKLKSENDKLQREASKVPKLEKELSAALDDLKLYKVESSKATKLKQQAEAQLGAERTAKKNMSTALSDARKAQLDAENKVHRLQSDLKFDKMAREGQVKKSRIIEHEMLEYKHDNFLQTKLRSEAEHRATTMNVALQKERSMRLQDIHARNKVIIAKQVSERNEKIAELERFKEVAKAKQLESEVGGLKAAIKSQTQIIGLNDNELNDSLVEVEKVRLECLQLKRDLQAAEEEALRHMEIRQSLEQENHRLGTELMARSKTASERTKPLETAARGRGTTSLSIERARAGMTRPETTSAMRIRRRKQEVRNKEFSRVFTATGDRRPPSSGAALPVEGGSAITLDEAFIIPIHAPALPVQGGRQVGQSLISASGLVDGGLGQTSPDGRLGSAGVTWGQSRDGSRVLSPMQRMPSALKKSRRGSASTPLNMASGSGSGLGPGGGGGSWTDGGNTTPGVQRGQEGVMMEGSPEPQTPGSPVHNPNGSSVFADEEEERPKSKAKKKGKMRRTGSTLNAPGSLFLGSGLGLKKSASYQ